MNKLSAQNKTKQVKNILPKTPLYYLDLRSLGLFRIILSLLLILNIIEYKIQCFEIYSPESSYFGNHLLEKSKGHLLSPIDFITSDILLYVYFGIMLLLAFFLLIGYNSRISSLLLFVMFAAFNIRYIDFVFGWDRYIESLLFFSIILPVNQRFSLFKPKEVISSNIYTSKLIFIPLIQISLIYFVAGVGKSGDYWKDGSAAAFLMSDCLLKTDFSSILVNSSGWIKLFSYGTLVFEFLSFFMIFLPYKNQYFRGLYVLAIIIFHWSISLFADVGYFKYAGTAAAILLIPTFFWDKFEFFKINYVFKWNDFSLKIHPKIEEIIAKYQKKIVYTFVFYTCFMLLLLNIQFIVVRKDKVGKFLQKSTLLHQIGNIQLPVIGFSSIFKPDWYLYAPNPTNELGYINIEMKDSDSKIWEVFTTKIDSRNKVLLSPKIGIFKFYIVKYRTNYHKEKYRNNLIDWFGFETEKYAKAHKNVVFRKSELVLYSLYTPSYIANKKLNLSREVLVEAVIGY